MDRSFVYFLAKYRNTCTMVDHVFFVDGDKFPNAFQEASRIAYDYGKQWKYGNLYMLTQIDEATYESYLT